MALASTLYDFQLSLSNVDRSVAEQLSLKVARHPSETMARVWLRVLAYCWLWEERLVFGPGLSTPDAPDLETRDFTGAVTRWVRVGRADPSAIQRTIHQNPGAQVCVLFESVARMDVFLSEARTEGLARVASAQVAAVEPAFIATLAADESRRQKATVTLVGDHFYVDRSGRTVDGPLLHGTM